MKLYGKAALIGGTVRTQEEIEADIAMLRGKIERNEEKFGNPRTCSSARSLLRVTLGEDGRRLRELEEELSKIPETEGNVVASAAA